MTSPPFLVPSDRGWSVAAGDDTPPLTSRVLRIRGDKSLLPVALRFWSSVFVPFFAMTALLVGCPRVPSRWNKGSKRRTKGLEKVTSRSETLGAPQTSDGRGPMGGVGSPRRGVLPDLCRPLTTGLDSAQDGAADRPWGS